MLTVCILFELRISFFLCVTQLHLFVWLSTTPSYKHTCIHTCTIYTYHILTQYSIYIYKYIHYIHTLSLTLLLLPPLYPISTGFGDVPAAQSGARGNHLLLRRGRQRPARIPQRKHYYYYILFYCYPYHYIYLYTLNF